MKQTVTESMFMDAFRNYDRYNEFGYDALSALFEYYEELEESGCEEIELDVIAICCEWTQYDSASEAAKEMITDFDREEGEEDDDYEARALEELQENTNVLEYDGGIVVESF